jgi:hypothetical protein
MSNNPNVDTRCCLCGGKCEKWPSGGGYGHNAEPLASGRCCDACNKSKVIPARIFLILPGVKGRAAQ